ncbi:MAG TPA: GNAT family N-acetyltransferase [Pyrinomonadaceae bacterium]|nr:GNAT family N-acetyltransferase [Pyrinomonadaceae bacterium]
MISIREYRAEDRRQVEECFVELQEFERRIEPRRVEGRAVVEKYLRFMFDKCAQTEGTVFVLEDDGRVVGFVSVWAKLKVNGLVNEEAEVAYVSDLFVNAAYRGRGLGRALLQRAEDYSVAKGATTLNIGVLAENTGARRLYNDFGFREDKVELTKPLTPAVEAAT